MKYHPHFSTWLQIWVFFGCLFFTKLLILIIHLLSSLYGSISGWFFSFVSFFLYSIRHLSIQCSLSIFHFSSRILRKNQWFLSIRARLQSMKCFLQFQCKQIEQTVNEKEEDVKTTRHEKLSILHFKSSVRQKRYLSIFVKLWTVFYSLMTYTRLGNCEKRLSQSLQWVALMKSKF